MRAFEAVQASKAAEADEVNEAAEVLGPETLTLLKMLLNSKMS